MNTSPSPDLAFARKLIEFNFWENQRVWDLAIAPLTDDQFSRDLGYAGGSIQRACIHIMEAEWNRLVQILGAGDTEEFSTEYFADRAAIRSRWTMVGEAWLQFAKALDSKTFFSTRTFESDGRMVEL